MGNKKKKSGEQLLLNEDTANEGLVTAVSDVASDQQAAYPDADSTNVPNARQRRKDKRKETAATLTISAGDHIEDTVAAAAAGLSTKKQRRQDSAGDDHAATDCSAADKHDILKNAKKRKQHDRSAGDRSVEARGADVESENDRDNHAAPAKPKSKKFRSGTTSVQHFSALDEQPDASPVSKKNGCTKAASQQDSLATSSKKSSKNRKAMHAENSKSGSISDTRPPKNTRKLIEQQAVTAATTAKSSSESPALDKSSTDVGQKPSKKAKKLKKKKPTKKDSSKTEGHAVAETDTPKVSARDAALAYLDEWKSDKNNWSFQKVRQVWLLQHMYSVADVDDDRFAILLEYLEPLKGKARAETVRKAEEMLAKADDDNGAAGADGGSVAPAVNELALLRAKEIVQQLSTD